MHPRKAIRAAIAATLAAVPDLGGRVSRSRVRRTEDDELPAVIVYALKEQSGLATLKRSLDRQATVAIEIRAAANDELDDVLDGLCALVEDAMEADPSFGRAALNSWLAETAIGLSGHADLQHAVAVLSYTVQYRTNPGSV